MNMEPCFWCGEDELVELQGCRSMCDTCKSMGPLYRAAFRTMIEADGLEARIKSALQYGCNNPYELEAALDHVAWIKSYITTARDEEMDVRRKAGTWGETL